MFFTPMEIQNVEFKKVKHGYSDQEVDTFIDKVLSDYQEMQKEIDSLQSKITILNDGMAKYKSMESSLKETLILAQHTADQVKESAAKQSESIISDAENRADKIVQGAKLELLELNRKLKDLKSEAELFKADYASVLSAELEKVNSFDVDTAVKVDLGNILETPAPAIQVDEEDTETTDVEMETEAEPSAEPSTEHAAEPLTESANELPTEPSAEPSAENDDGAVTFEDQADAVGESKDSDEISVEAQEENAANETNETNAEQKSFFRRRSAAKVSSDIPEQKDYKSRFLADMDSDEDEGSEDAIGKKSDLKKWFLDD